jgi:hypothetical protein
VLPTTREQIVTALESVAGEGARYWGAFDTPVFFEKVGESWSPAESARHLVKSIRAVVKALATPRITLRLLFGKPRRPSVTYEELRTRYLGVLEAGGRAGRFAPSARTESDLAAWRATILQQLGDVNRDLCAAIGRWSDTDLDRYQLPHPLLGKITVREMLFFTLYHQHHHMDVTERRRREQSHS